MIFDGQMTFEDWDEQYKQFVDKFKPKKTTDDCYTPPEIYECVKNWACEKYGIDEKNIVRPFFPNGDFERFDYPENCFVLDNPPFSILARILRFYRTHNIRFFLFAPSLTLFNSGADNYVVVNYAVTYENGAKVNTSFVTSEGAWKIEVAPDLHDLLEQTEAKIKKETKKELRKISYPDCVVSAALLGKLACHGTSLRIKAEEVMPIRKLDCGIHVFGGGFLLSERAAAERAAAERAMLSERERAMLSERERAQQKMLGEK